MPDKPPITDNPWHALRRFTTARIALGRAGSSLPTAPQLAFQLAHAQARDAVHQALDTSALRQQLIDSGIAGAADCLIVDSAAGDRLTYLQRPDLGRQLSPAARQQLLQDGSGDGDDAARIYDIALVIADGLSPLAIARHTAPFLAAWQQLSAARQWQLAPLTIVRQARVAVGDEIGSLLRAKLVAVLIGERPGLSSPDSMGLYLSWMPQTGMRDAQRNCISNIRPQGLDFERAAAKFDYLLQEAHRRALTGVALKDESVAADQSAGLAQRNFLLD